ncbi:unnamed protein product [Ectocarpus sp. CCAP 1310/34]|nr:unnamed protein product [Ectocarpus sp. CCAP 1310/34]
MAIDSPSILRGLISSMYFVKMPDLPPALRAEFYFYREKDQPSLFSSTVLTTSKLALTRAFV